MTQNPTQVALTATTPPQRHEIHFTTAEYEDYRKGLPTQSPEAVEAAAGAGTPTAYPDQEDPLPPASPPLSLTPSSTMSPSAESLDLAAKLDWAEEVVDWSQCNPASVFDRVALQGGQDQKDKRVNKEYKDQKALSDAATAGYFMYLHTIREWRSAQAAGGLEQWPHYKQADHSRPHPHYPFVNPDSATLFVGASKPDPEMWSSYLLMKHVKRRVRRAISGRDLVWPSLPSSPMWETR